MIRKFVGAVASALALLAGLWLMIAPWALGTQPENADWTDPTTTEFWTGLGVAVVGLIGAVTFALAIYEDLVTRGLVVVKPRKAEPEPEPVAAAPQASSAELATLLAPLVEALREDINRTDRTGGEHRQNGKATLVGVEENR
ncbi:hypothetical protein MF672_011560 [Actinomadura sp. ATCC 31491]|uniref:Alkaline shock response membrane anchor protein AmaP n=1 Tax=Actinomadura luzonensis TaxID=2805427 RepID=A0ABT0FQ01_9ACTN|nr:hypothetical protein [Actinomadura luzonensis]MCK2214422.1 hypothetical protein [Actinomadura luzonensis]